jgi:hypothetical protein
MAAQSVGLAVAFSIGNIALHMLSTPIDYVAILPLIVALRVSVVEHDWCTHAGNELIPGKHKGLHIDRSMVFECRKNSVHV